MSSSQYVWLVGPTPSADEWKSTTMGHGAQCVMTTGTSGTVMWRVDSWALQLLLRCIHMLALAKERVRARGGYSVGERGGYDVRERGGYSVGKCGGGTV